VKTDLSRRSARTLAWLGDAVFEREVRFRIASRGDYPVDRLDAMKAEVVRAETQAELLDAIEPRLDEAEADVVQRGRNAQVSASGGAKRDVRTYRRATALEALVAYWATAPEPGWVRFDELLDGPLREAIDRAVQRRSTKLRRG
jgi:ribonuclease-3 family protein